MLIWRFWNNFDMPIRGFKNDVDNDLFFTFLSIYYFLTSFHLENWKYFCQIVWLSSISRNIDWLAKPIKLVLRIIELPESSCLKQISMEKKFFEKKILLASFLNIFFYFFQSFLMHIKVFSRNSETSKCPKKN
jgi:hypothetical protein